jgi:Tol biopolymer transport system component
LAGGGEQRLTEGSDFTPRFSPDGSSVLFLRDEGESYAAYRIALVGGQPRKILENVMEAEWSPDGNQLVYLRSTGAGKTEIGKLEIDSRTETSLLEMQDWVLFGLRWSPDGSRIAISRGARLGGAVGWGMVIVDPESGGVEEIAGLDPAALVSRSTWTQKGRSLTFAVASNTVGDITGVPSRVVRRSPKSGGLKTLFWASGLFPFRGSISDTTSFTALGEGQVIFDRFSHRGFLRAVSLSDATDELLTLTTAVDRQPAYSPDGGTVVFSSNRTGNLDLWALDVESGGMRQLTDDAAQDWDPGFSPDGESILFSSDRSGNLEIWMSEADGSNPRQVSHDGVDAENPTMTADGNWIVYSSGNPNHSGIFKVRPDGSDSTQLVAGLFTNPEVSPDGRWALYVHSAQSKQGNVRVLEIDTGEVVDWEIRIPIQPQSPNVTYGRGRWIDGGKAIAFVGLDERGKTGVYAQDFVPGENTLATRRRLAGFYDNLITESFGARPDSLAITLALKQETRTLMLAEGLGSVDK